MPKPITKRLIETAKPPKTGRLEIKDSKTPGLYLYVSKTGAKTLGFRGKCRGRGVKHSFGNAEAVRLEDVKQTCFELYADCRAGKWGGVISKVQTFGDLMDYCHEAKRKNIRNQEWHDNVKRHAAGLWTKPIHGIDAATLRRLHLKIGADSGKVMANRIIARIKAAYNVASKDGVIRVESNPAAACERFKEQPRQRYLEGDDLRKWLKALEGETELFRDALLLLLASGRRSCEVKRMRFDEIDFERALWTIPDTKNGQTQTIPLNADAFEILERRREKVDGEFVFPAMRSQSRTGHISRLDKAMERVCKRAGLSDYHNHDLRHSFASHRVNAGENLYVIGRLLGHTNLASTKRYSHLNEERVRQAANSVSLKVYAG